MEEKKAKIKNLTTEIVGNQNQWHKVSIWLENGEYGVAFYSQPTKLKIGDEITYSIEVAPDNTQKLKNVKKVYAEKPVGNGNGNGFGGFKKNNAETDKRIAKQVAVKSATDLVVAGKVDLKDLFALSEKIYKYLNKFDDQ